jgi:hypothetical protein
VSTVNETLSAAEQLLVSVRAALAPDSLESRMDAAVGCDSEVVRHLRHLLGVPVGRPGCDFGRENIRADMPAPPSSLERDQQVGDERRADAAPGQFPDYLLDSDTDGGGA